jgi:flagellar basal body-associated protein FliL
MSIGYQPELDKKVSGFRSELETKQTDIKEIVYRTFGEKTVQEWEVKNLPSIEEELLQKINAILKMGHITDIFFDTYIIHRP